MKVLSLLMKIAGTGVVCVWGAFFGLVFPTVILARVTDPGVIPDVVADSTGLLVIWLVTSCIYILSAAFIFRKKYRIAAVLSVIGLVGIITVKVMFGQLTAGNDRIASPDELYLPLIFVTLLDIFILAVEERHNIAKLFADSSKKEEQAPSILADPDNTDDR